MWADAGRGHADAHVQRLPCSEVLQRRSPKDGFEKSRIGRESVDGAAQGYLLCMIECESESESARARARTHEREEFIDNQQVTAQSVSKTLSPVFSRPTLSGNKREGGEGRGERGCLLGTILHDGDKRRGGGGGGDETRLKSFGLLVFFSL